MQSLKSVKDNSSKAKMVAVLFVILVVLGGVIWHTFSRSDVKNKNAETTVPEYFGSYEQLNSVPSRTDAPTNDPDVLVAWMDQRGIDGNLSCTIYLKVDRRVLAVYIKTGGLSPQGTTDTHTDYKDSDVSKSTIDQIAKDYCEAKQ